MPSTVKQEDGFNRHTAADLLAIGTGLRYSIRKKLTGRSSRRQVVGHIVAAASSSFDYG